MKTIRILADDLTGALDTAASFSGEVPVFIDRAPERDDPGWDVPVGVVATATRDVPAGALPAHLEPVLDWFRSGDLAYKKVDSLLRGNSFSEILWLLGEGGFPGAVFAPAFPQQGRLTFEDRQWIVKPGRDDLPVARLSEGFEGRRTVNGARPEGTDIWIPEVRRDADLDRIADLASDPDQRRRLWSGSAGLAQALARRHGLAPGEAAGRPVRAAGTTLLISASFQPAFREQWALLKADLPTPAIAEGALAEEIGRAIDHVRAGALDGRFDLSPRHAMAPEEALALLRLNVGRIVGEVPRPGRLRIVGGDTLLSLCRATGAQGLLAGASVRPGWGCATLVGGCWDGTGCDTRSGAFGEPDDLIRIMRLSGPLGKEA